MYYVSQSSTMKPFICFSLENVRKYIEFAFQVYLKWGKNILYPKYILKRNPNNISKWDQFQLRYKNWIPNTPQNGITPYSHSKHITK